jgi:hypothetical protein
VGRRERVALAANPQQTKEHLDPVRLKTIVRGLVTRMPHGLTHRRTDQERQKIARQKIAPERQAIRMQYRGQ